MRRHLLLITNNPRAAAAFASRCQVDLQPELGYQALLGRAARILAQGGRLLTHPLAGSLKPRQTPFRSLLIDSRGGGDIEGARLLEQALAAYERQMQGQRPPQWPEAIREDFAALDASFMEGAWQHMDFLR